GATRSDYSLSGGARRGVMPRCRRLWRSPAASYALSACSLAGRLRGRPQGRLIGSTASRVASIICPSGTLAPERVTANGTPADRPQHGASCPICRDPSDSGRSLGPPGGRHGSRVNRRPAPIDLVSLAPRTQQRLADFLPHPL